MVLRDIDFNEIPANENGSTTPDDDDSSIEGGFSGSVSDDSENGSETDELKFDKSGSRSSSAHDKWCVGSVEAGYLLEELLEGKDPSEICEDDVIGMKFVTVEAIEIFYQKYSLYAGFGVRRDDKKRYGQGIVVSKRWVCNRVGVKAIREDDGCGVKQWKEKPVTRVRCRAAIKVKLDNLTMRYVC